MIMMHCAPPGSTWALIKFGQFAQCLPFPPSLSGAVNCDDHHGCRCNADKVHNGNDDDTVMVAMMMAMMMMMVGNLQDVCACFAVMLLSGIRHPMQ